MLKFYFTLSRTSYQHASRQTNKIFYVEVHAESKEVAKDAFIAMHPTGYSDMYNENTFKPDLRHVLIQVITQTEREINL